MHDNSPETSDTDAQSAVRWEGNSWVWLFCKRKWPFVLLFLPPLQLILEGVAKAVDEPERAYRGFVAVDDINLQPMSEGNTDACFGKLSSSVQGHTFTCSRLLFIFSSSDPKRLSCTEHAKHVHTERNESRQLSLWRVCARNRAMHIHTHSRRKRERKKKKKDRKKEKQKRKQWLHPSTSKLDVSVTPCNSFSNDSFYPFH